jgi:hypothetical protein
MRPVWIFRPSVLPREAPRQLQIRTHRNSIAKVKGQGYLRRECRRPARNGTASPMSTHGADNPEPNREPESELALTRVVRIPHSPISTCFPGKHGRDSAPHGDGNEGRAGAEFLFRGEASSGLRPSVSLMSPRTVRSRLTSENSSPATPCCVRWYTPSLVSVNGGCTTVTSHFLKSIISLLSHDFSPTEDTSLLPGGTPEIGSSRRVYPPVVHLLRGRGPPPPPLYRALRGRSKSQGLGLPVELVSRKPRPKDSGSNWTAAQPVSTGPGVGNPAVMTPTAGPWFGGGGRPWSTGRLLERRPACPANRSRNSMGLKTWSAGSPGASRLGRASPAFSVGGLPGAAGRSIPVVLPGCFPGKRGA